MLHLSYLRAASGEFGSSDGGGGEGDHSHADSIFTAVMDTHPEAHCWFYTDVQISPLITSCLALIFSAALFSVNMARQPPLLSDTWLGLNADL